MLSVLSYLHASRCTHTDLKPENILFRYENNWESVFDSRRRRYHRKLTDNRILIIDFGSAVFDWEHHSKIVSTRHYRAPEVIYGLPWNQKIDIWSLGCLLFEFYTGKTMFQTHDNVEHLAMMEATLGRPPRNFAKSCQHQFYNEEFKLKWDESNQDGQFVRSNCKSLMRWNKKPSNADHQFFFDLLALMLNYLPEKRLSAAYCRKHPFFSDLDSIYIQPRARSLNRSEPRKIRHSVRTTSQSSYFSSFSMTK